MQNSDFRNLSTTVGKASTRPALLGSRPRTTLLPRSIKHTFTQPSAKEDSGPPTKKVRTSAPKGSRLAQGYTDRARQRNEVEDNGYDDKPRTKGLDFEALRRARNGDQDEGEGLTDKTGAENQVDEVDVDEELDQALEKDVVAAPRVSASEKTELIRPHTRDEILAQLKQRRRQPELEQPQVSDLDQSKFRKLESLQKPGRRKFTETINGRRREVLVITNQDGSTKRKTRWIDPEPDAKRETQLIIGGDLDTEVLGKQTSSIDTTVPEPDEDEDIFGNAAEYDPLAGLEDEDEEQEQEDSNTDSKLQRQNKSHNLGSSSSQPHRIFDTSSTQSDYTGHDTQILSALKRAAQLRQTDTTAHQNQDKNAQLLAKLQSQAHGDEEDLDMEFGESRDFNDGDEQDKTKLSTWRGLNAGEEDEESDGDRVKGKKGEKKTKKKKGDKNSFKDVMSVIERRKG